MPKQRAPHTQRAPLQRIADLLLQIGALIFILATLLGWAEFIAVYFFEYSIVELLGWSVEPLGRVNNQ